MIRLLSVFALLFSLAVVSVHAQAQTCQPTLEVDGVSFPFLSSEVINLPLLYDDGDVNRLPLGVATGSVPPGARYAQLHSGSDYQRWTVQQRNGLGDASTYWFPLRDVFGYTTWYAWRYWYSFSSPTLLVCYYGSSSPTPSPTSLTPSPTSSLSDGLVVTPIAATPITSGLPFELTPWPTPDVREIEYGVVDEGGQCYQIVPAINLSLPGGGGIDWDGLSVCTRRFGIALRYGGVDVGAIVLAALAFGAAWAVWVMIRRG